jgi:hypothetical protein
MRIKLLKPVAGPWGTEPVGREMEIPSEIAEVWITDGVALAIVDPEPVSSETSEDETPEDETPEDETPEDETPEDETPEDETPEDETPAAPSATPKRARSSS